MDKQTRVGRGPSLSYEIKRAIRMVYEENPSKSAKEIMRVVHEKLRDDHMQIEPGWPGISIIQKQLAVIRETDKKLKPEDQPWHILADTKYDIPPDVLPAVMIEWAKAIKKDKPLTIRQVKWITRLYYVLKNEKDEKIYHHAVMTIATEEKVRELMDVDMEEERDMWWNWQNDAFLYSLMTKDNVPLEKVTEQIRKQIEATRHP